MNRKTRFAVAVLLADIMIWSLSVVMGQAPASQPAAILPTPEQAAWQDLEVVAFAHFGMNTFTDREWGEGKEDPHLFNPTAFDAGQWVKALKPAGVKLLILTAKHHDGFCLWPSRFTEHSVKNSPWREGKGDVVKEVAEACRQGGIKFGVYLSPWDRHEPTYGDSPAYNRHFLDQLRELLTDYGPVAEVWFDGACGEGPNGKKQEYDWAAYYQLIRELQPKALIAITGPDIRWVGNENGLAREEEHSVQPASPTQHPGKDRVWWPAECDVSIRPGWFFHTAENDRVKSLDDLMHIYYQSVGRNASLLLNVPPDRRGLIHENDTQRLAQFGAEISRRFGRSLAEAHGQGEAVELSIQPPRIVDHVMIMEDIAQGERVNRYVVEGNAEGSWKELAHGEVIGHKKIHRFEPQILSKVRLRVLQSSQEAKIRKLAAYGTSLMVPASQLATDPQRPSYHFLPPHNWMNDPNGLVQFKGEYHLFYQYNPESAVWGNMTWGHAVSRDLVRWQHLPHALKPDQPYDQGGVFSGCMVIDNGVATAVYTGVSPEVQCIATSNDGRTWEKFAGNPVLAGPPPGLEVTGFRDPCVWKQDGVWHMVIGSGIKDRGGTILLYKSKDLRKWDYVGPALVGDQAKTGPMWECPNLFPVGNKWILTISPYGSPMYFMGTFANDHFNPESQGQLDLGGPFYAPQLFRDDRGRLIMFGWLREDREHAEEFGWQGVQTLPRVITLGEDGRPRFAPAEEVDTLRQGSGAALLDLAVQADKLLTGAAGAYLGDCLDIVAEIEPGNAEQVGLQVRVSETGICTPIYYDRKAGKLVIDRTRSADRSASKADLRMAPLELAEGETLKLRILLDRSVVEVFANGRTCLTARVYPPGDSLHTSLHVRGGKAHVKKLEMWPMKSIW